VKICSRVSLELILGSGGSPEGVLVVEGDMGKCSEGWGRCLGVINPKEYQNRKWFLVHRNFPETHHTKDGYCLRRVRVEYHHEIDGEPTNLTALEGAAP